MQEFRCSSDVLCVWEGMFDALQDVELAGRASGSDVDYTLALAADSLISESVDR